MGIKNSLKLLDLSKKIEQQTLSGAPVASMLSTGKLAEIFYSNLAGLKPPALIDRAQAMSIPSVVKARNLIVETLARQPLAVFEQDAMLETQPEWLSRSDTLQSPHTRMVWTLDDLIFYGKSLWLIDRAEDGVILDAVRIPQGWWQVAETGEISISANGSKQIVNPENCILFEGSHEGLLDIAGRTLQGAIDLENTWLERVKSPAPLVELHITERDADFDNEEALEIAKLWESRRQTSGTAVTPYGMEARLHGDKVTDLFIEGRNALRLDIALLLNIPSSLLEGSQATSTLTYSTQEGRRNELVDYSLSAWAAPIEARLSMDDVTPKGSRIAFDIAYMTTPEQPQQFPTTRD